MWKVEDPVDRDIQISVYLNETSRSSYGKVSHCLKFLEEGGVGPLHRPLIKLQLLVPLEIL